MYNISILGAGHLAKSLLAGLNHVSEAEISIFNRTESKIDDLRRTYMKLRKEENLCDLVKEKTLLFCIVPATALIKLDINLIRRIKETNSILISCANGLPLKTLEGLFGDLKIVRLLPNVNWQICEGVSLFDCSENVTQDEINGFCSFLTPVSRLYRVKSDIDFDRIGTLTTCSPGLLSTLIEYFLEYFDIQTYDEKVMFYESLRGTIDYILHSRKNPNAISTEVANKGGLTEVGIKAIQREFPRCIEAVSTSMKEKIKERNKIFEQ